MDYFFVTSHLLSMLTRIHYVITKAESYRTVSKTSGNYGCDANSPTCSSEKRKD